MDKYEEKRNCEWSLIKKKYDTIYSTEFLWNKGVHIYVKYIKDSLKKKKIKKHIAVV